jgi:broad specificity phosphatase PhoE
MGMPNLITFVWHGESEANVIQKIDKNHGDVDTGEAIAVRDRLDYKQRLSVAGINQVKATRNWLINNIDGLTLNTYFHTFLVSDFLRARETAAYLSIGCPDIYWEIDDRLGERSWGVHGPLSIEERERKYDITSKLMEADPYHAAFEGGESIQDVKNNRFRDLLDSWHREQEGKNILVVTHGDFIRAAMVGIERLLPEQFEDNEKNPDYKIRNCTILQYSRVNPKGAQDIRSKLTWKRMVFPASHEHAPDDGKWVELPGRPKQNSSELLENINRLAPNLLFGDSDENK